MGSRGGVEWLSCIGTVTYIKSENAYYAGCPHPFNGRTCQKKMSETSPGEWYCERCAKSSNEPLFRRAAAAFSKLFGGVAACLPGRHWGWQYKRHAKSSNDLRLLACGGGLGWLLASVGCAVCLSNCCREQRCEGCGEVWCACLQHAHDKLHQDACSTVWGCQQAVCDGTVAFTTPTFLCSSSRTRENKKYATAQHGSRLLRCRPPRRYVLQSQ